MYKKLRIIFTVCSALCVAAAFPVAFAFGFAGFIPTALAAVLFFGLMLLCKQAQEFKEAQFHALDENEKQTDGETQNEKSEEENQP